MTAARFVLHCRNDYLWKHGHFPFGRRAVRQAIKTPEHNGLRQYGEILIKYSDRRAQLLLHAMQAHNLGDVKNSLNLTQK